jgi:hypothetical protein
VEYPTPEYPHQSKQPLKWQTETKVSHMKRKRVIRRSWEGVLGVVGGKVRCNGLRIHNNDIVGLCDFVVSGMHNKVLSDGRDHLVAAVEGKVQTAGVGGRIALGGDVHISGGIQREPSQGSSAGDKLALIKGNDVAGDGLDRLVQGAVDLAQNGKGAIELAVVDVRRSKLRAGISKLVGDERVSGGKVKLGNNVRRGNPLGVESANCSGRSLTDNKIVGSVKEIDLGACQIGGIVDNASSVESIHGSIDQVHVDQSRLSHASNKGNLKSVKSAEVGTAGHDSNSHNL